ncbi:ubiquinone-dependent pyruvate dehydrogenase [Acidocella aminolytica]|uniref:Pyruvate dehydrogenase [ubiquinone] n=1 Tax=Acidocella aminolytica 101 = DSM 11237 TaxID=1120923 RepID=A0A0D6PFP3_9PROT|nr:ubiquinone-dependent pyruvate dehydrogenase [Acidocella aminolytica]GAN80580.1 pyruvate dehydrogenase/acetolactate synthase large subunit [Acidocella aminolytica 101 = DSM 11237]GBQ32501.1 thiamine pyrophosphate-requiring enzyme [Acidocella aminolytica 101 = DSM 11237]SHF57334.1 pyruvate dehydrogenase (quinone) [Acidocella aminolytica 101 = DSM 11237]
MQATAASYMAATLAAAGVRRVYGVVGDSLNGFTDALREQGRIDWKHMRHEEGAAFAAGAEAQLTGRLAVCAGSCGPGNLHLINGLFDAHRSQAPVLAIAAHIPSTEIGIDYFQATHPEILFKECSHYCELVSNPRQLPQILERAIRAAVASKGVAVVIIPGDVALGELKAAVPSFLLPEPPVVRPSDMVLEETATLLNGTNRTTILCGAGCEGAHDEVIALAAKLQAPIVHALRGKEHVEHDNPYDVGMTGFIGFASGYKALKSCDTLVMLGTGFPYRQFYPEAAKVVQIDIRPEALGNRCPLAKGLVGDVKETLKVLLPRLVQQNDESFLRAAVADYHEARAELDELAKITPASKHVHPQQLNRLVSELAAPDAIFTCDVGTPTVWAARYLRLGGGRRLLGSFNHGSMANALLQAIGAQAAFPQRQVVSLSGDGGFTMMMGDFLTLSQLQLPVKVIVLNNGTLGFVELEMKANGFLDTGVDLQNPDFAAMANAMGVKGVRVDKPQDLEAGLREVLAHPGPALLDVVSARQELVMPPKTTAKDVKSFGLFLLKAVMNGRASQVVDLTKVNLFR